MDVPGTGNASAGAHIGSGSSGGDAGDAPLRTFSDVAAAGAAGLPEDFPTNSYDLLCQSAHRHGERTAISYFATVETHSETRTLGYRSLLREVTRAANLFDSLGVGATDVVALLLPNLPETHFALWGAEAAGIVMPINPMLEARAIGSLMVAARAKVLVTAAVDPATIAKIIAALAVAPGVEHVVLVSATNGEFKRISTLIEATTPIAVHDFAQGLSQATADRRVSGRQISPDDVASYFCTGGTTGLPKIAVRTHRQTMANAWMIQRMFGSAIDENSVLFCGLPLFHVNAVMLTGLVPFLKGASVLLGTPQGYRAPGLVARFWEIVERHAVTAFSGVPTLLVSLLEYRTAGCDLSSLRFAICAASPLSAELLHRFERACQVSVCEAYGLTETVCGASFNPVDGEHRPGSVGFALPLQRIEIVLLDQNGRYLHDAATGEIGVVAIAGPNIFSGYLDPQHERIAWIDRKDGRKWLNSGDLGRFDADGYLWLTGRAKDVIIRGGHNIDPAVIEEALYSHPAVGIAAAVGRPDRRVGELPVAYVQLRADASVEAAALLDFVVRAIGERAAIPKAITILDAMPLTAVGKIHKPTLRYREAVAATREAIGATGIEQAAVDLLEDGVGGATVRIRVDAADQQRVQEALLSFAFAYRIEVSSAGERPA
ncbi:acyl-CoA synthetase [Sphingomonas sp. PAMC 26605]|uniref:acyl-CoA synthetase n=1 Tax=Sphingomonas sp. PAMC 26605 TaxID=1112214 RepID=UPI00026CB111|nr:acyl-CoA synthetase [Sphingomonas sp. PAMC 26605]